MELIKKNIITVIVIVLSILILGLPIIGYIRWNNIYSNIIKTNWNIELSKQYKEIYSIDSGPSFHGDGERYHIFQYYDDKNISSCLEWKNDQNLFVEDDINNILSDLDISEGYFPDFKKTYKYYYKTAYDSSKLYIVFFPGLNRIYIVEHFL